MRNILRHKRKKKSKQKQNKKQKEKQNKRNKKGKLVELRIQNDQKVLTERRWFFYELDTAQILYFAALLRKREERE